MGRAEVPQKCQIMGVGGMEVHLVPMLVDNYGYVLVHNDSKEAYCVDPVEPDKVIKYCADIGVKLTGVLTTHHHWDHAGGNDEISKKVPGITIVGGADEGIPSCTKPVKHNEEFNFRSIAVRCLKTPCHTRGHVQYFVTEPKNPEGALFSGDTLFLAGCGRFFEGSPEDMHGSLIDVVSTLPDNTLVYCGHEYSVKNLQFAKHVEPQNEAVHKKLQWCQEKRAESKPTIPSRLGEEKSYNPFMRVREAAVQQHVQSNDPVATMGLLRKQKDSF